MAFGLLRVDVLAASSPVQARRVHDRLPPVREVVAHVLRGGSSSAPPGGPDDPADRGEHQDEGGQSDRHGSLGLEDEDRGGDEREVDDGHERLAGGGRRGTDARTSLISSPMPASRKVASDEDAWVRCELLVLLGSRPATVLSSARSHEFA
jgi:hypothetical protein